MPTTHPDRTAVRDHRRQLHVVIKSVTSLIRAIRSASGQAATAMDVSVTSRDSTVGCRVATWGPGALDRDGTLDTVTGQGVASRRETLERIFRTALAYGWITTLPVAWFAST